MTENDLAVAILQGTDDAVVFADREGVIRLWNPAAEAMFGYPADEALGSTLDLIVPERFRERHWAGYREVMGSGVTRYAGRLLAVPAQRRDGERISVEFTVTLVTAEAGEVEGVAAIVRDVTARRAQEQAVRQELGARRARAGSAGPEPA